MRLWWSAGGVALVKGLVGLPDGKHLVEQFVHAMPQSDAGGFAGGELSGVKGLDRGVESDGGEGRHPEHLADEIASAGAHALLSPGDGSARLVDSRGIDFGEDSEVADELLRPLESVNREDFGDQHSCGAGTNAGDGDEVSMATGGEAVEREFNPGETLRFALLTVADGLDGLHDEVFGERAGEGTGGGACRLLEVEGAFWGDVGELRK